MSNNPTPCKCVVVGDIESNKATIVKTYFENEELTYKTVVIDEKPYKIEFYDTSGQEDLEHVRKVNYKGCDILFICYSIGSFNSFHNVSAKWYIEFQQHCPEAHLVLVGTDKYTRQERFTSDTVTTEQGMSKSNEIHSNGFYECSHGNREEISVVVEDSIRKWSNGAKTRSRARSLGSALLSLMKKERKIKKSTGSVGSVGSVTGSIGSSTGSRGTNTDDHKIDSPPPSKPDSIPPPLPPKPRELEKENMMALTIEKQKRKIFELEQKLASNKQEQYKNILFVLDYLKVEDSKRDEIFQELDNMIQETKEEMPVIDQSIIQDKSPTSQKKRLQVIVNPPFYWNSALPLPDYNEINLDKDSFEFGAVEYLMNSTMGVHAQHGTVDGVSPAGFAVQQVIRVENRHLWSEYSFRKKSIIEKYKGKLDCESSSSYLRSKSSYEYFLFHGTNWNTIDILKRHGYDTRVSSLIGMFGGGFYLGENSSKSNQYVPCPNCNGNSVYTPRPCICENQQEILFRLILYRVIVGDAHIAVKYDSLKYKGISDDPNKKSVNFDSLRKIVRRPPVKPNSTESYDCVIGESISNGGNALNYREIVVYDRNYAYPEYIITYRREKVKSYNSTINMDDVKNFFVKQ